MSSYHGWTHAPKEQGGTDPIPTAPGTSGLTTLFKCDSNSDQFIADTVTTDLHFATDVINEGSPFTTSNHITFTLAAGIWDLSVTVALEYTNPGVDGEAHLQLIDVTGGGGVISECLVTHSAPAAGTVYQFTLTSPTMVEYASVNQVKARLINTLGDTVRVIGSGDLTYLKGAVLMVP